MRLKHKPSWDIEYNDIKLGEKLYCGVCGQEYTYDPNENNEYNCSYECATGG